MKPFKPKFTRILSIDGGGIRGIIPGQIIVSLEKKLKDFSGDPDARIADYFDLIAGTSTGGILTCIYLAPVSASSKMQPRFSAEEAVNLYFEWGHKIFDVSLWRQLRSAGGLLEEKYDETPLEDVLKQYFGNLKLSQLLKPCLVTAYDLKRITTKFFTQHDAVKDRAQDFYVRDVARATSAAPSYFEAALIESLEGEKFPLLDGGIFANNPALCAYSEVRHKFTSHPTAKNIAMLSIGVGFSKKGYNYEEVKDWNFLEWVKPLSQMMRFGVNETVDYQLKQIFDAAGANNQYLRVDFDDRISSGSIDDASEENLNNLKNAGDVLAKDFDKELDKFVELLFRKKNFFLNLVE
jgi:patatin-like phospholipase/acyl hydrolase